MEENLEDWVMVRGYVKEKPIFGAESDFAISWSSSSRVREGIVDSSFSTSRTKKWYHIWYCRGGKARHVEEDLLLVRARCLSSFRCVASHLCVSGDDKITNILHQSMHCRGPRFRLSPIDPNALMI